MCEINLKSEVKFQRLLYEAVDKTDYGGQTRKRKGGRMKIVICRKQGSVVWQRVCQI